MVAVLLVMLIAAVPAGPTPSPSARSSKDQARISASIGTNDLHLGRLSEAQANCDAALKLDPADDLAQDCLKLVAVMLVDRDLNDADTKLLSGDKSAAIALASKWARA